MTKNSNTTSPNLVGDMISVLLSLMIELYCSAIKYEHYFIFYFRMVYNVLCLI